jgi:hypothetical protein
MATALEPVFPNITRWVKDHGIVEVGYDPNTDSFVRATDDGGGVWAGKPRYETLDDALMDLEEGIKAALKSRKTRKKRAPAAAMKTATKPDRRKTKPAEDGLPKQVQKLEEIIEAIRRRERVEITRLTVVKKLCEDHGAARAYALFLARKAQGRLREKKGAHRYLALANRAIREMKSAPDQSPEEINWSLLEVLGEIKAEQNEYKSTRWGMVRQVECWDLLIIEQALRGFDRKDEAPYWLYQATRDYVGGSTFLEKRQIPQIEEIARFWRRYFKGKARQG